MGLLQTRTRKKPLGYAGDYLVIDWMYLQQCASASPDKLWDSFYHRQTAAEAVRNRKQFLCDVFSTACQQSPAGVSMLNLASGPGRDIAEAITETGASADGSHIHCVDMEVDALSHAQSIVNMNGVQATIEWELANVFRFKTARQYDLVWSAGLFDYLNDRLAVALLKKMWRWTKGGGKLIVGNFHPRNPTRDYMEWCIDWVLLHRTEDDYFRLCDQAGIPSRCVSMVQEPLGVITFCVATK